MQHNAFRVS